MLISFDDGVAWQRLETNLPVTPIWDLVVKGTDLVAATHGRSFWILDDITPLHQLQADIAVAVGAPLQAARHGALPAVRATCRGQDPKTHTQLQDDRTGDGGVQDACEIGERIEGAEQFLDAGENPPEGVIIQYWLRDTVGQSRYS